MNEDWKNLSQFSAIVSRLPLLTRRNETEIEVLSKDELEFLNAKYDSLLDQHKALEVSYEERGMAMRETGDMVRSLYLPKIDRAQNMLNTLLNIDLEKTTDKELIRNQIKEIKAVLK